MGWWKEIDLRRRWSADFIYDWTNDDISNWRAGDWKTLKSLGGFGRIDPNFQPISQSIQLLHEILPKISLVISPPRKNFHCEFSWCQFAVIRKNVMQNWRIFGSTKFSKIHQFLVGFIQFWPRITRNFVKKCHFLDDHSTCKIILYVKPDHSSLNYQFKEFESCAKVNDECILWHSSVSLPWLNNNKKIGWW